MHAGTFGRITGAVALSLSLIAPLATGRRQTGPAAITPPKPPLSATDQPQTTLGDQVDLALTIYNSSLALIRDVRQVSLPAGTFNLRFMDVAATINPTTVHLRSLAAPGLLNVLEQNYEYDLLEPDKLLRKYVGRKLTLVRDHVEDGSTVPEEIEAELVAYNNGPVWRIGGEIVTGLRADQYRFPELPENLYSRPTLVWMLENRGSAGQRVETSYLAGGMAWNADYVLTVARDDRAAQLGGWVTITNNSGTSFRNATLQLIAGDLHRVSEEYKREADRVAEKMSLAAQAPAAFAREAFSEYHLYALQRRTSVNDRQTKQISLLSADAIPVEKRFVVEGQQFYYRNRQHPGSPLKDLVKVYYRFRNDERAGLGVPMPAGTVRVYQADSKGSIQFAGEDRIDHTPKDETINLYTGNAFDIVCERKQVDFRKIADDVYEMAFEITLRNHKDQPIVVEVNEPIASDWQMLEASHRWTKTDAWAASFSAPVAAGGTTVVRYRVRVRW
jgi:hypothetical protein